jgi:hypothetical protein
MLRNRQGCFFVGGAGSRCTLHDATAPGDSQRLPGPYLNPNKQDSVINALRSRWRLRGSDPPRKLPFVFCDC